MIENLVALWLAAFALMGSPGPATLSLAGVGVAFGVRSGVCYLAGIILGTFGVLVMIATGVTGLILAEPALVVVLTIVAAAYILYLAWKIATAPVRTRTHSEAPAPAFSAGFVLAIANPKAFAAIGAVYSSHRLAEALFVDTAAKIAALTPVIMVVNAAWLAFGSSLSTFLGDPKTGQIANVAFAMMLVASVALAMFGIDW